MIRTEGNTSRRQGVRSEKARVEMRSENKEGEGMREPGARRPGRESARRLEAKE